MKEQFLQEKLIELTWMLGKPSFNAISPDFYDKHMKENKPFNAKQLKDFANFASQLTVAVMEIEEAEKEEETNSNLDKAIQILKDNGLKELEICRFGIYRQYELAGEKVSVQPIEWLGAEAEDIFGDRYDEVYEQLEELLGFIDEDYIYDVLGYDDEGQNKLILTQEGLTTKRFTI